MLSCASECDVWTQFLEYIEEKCSQTAFENWFAPIKLLQASDQGVTLEVPNVFVQEYLLENYQKDLQAFFPIHPNGQLAIEFVIAKPNIEKAQIIDLKPIIEVDEVELHLNQFYQFDNFIEGPSNQFIKSAAMGIAANPSKSYNPLFIHGKVGLGKTHLLHAVGHMAKQKHRNLKVQCITTEAFINDLVDNLRNKSVAQMKRYYRTLDILLVDDIQFLQNRVNFEEEFCNTFEALINQNKQIVITCDCPPSQLKLSERLIARMEWGLVAQMALPDLETRVAILQSKAESKGLKIPQHLAFYIGERISNSVRQLEGAVNRLTAHCHVMGKELTQEIVIEILGEMLCHTPTEKVSVDQILKSVAKVFDVKLSDLKGTSRNQAIALPRQVGMFLAKEMLSDSLSLIGSAFGKTHSTILHAHKTIFAKKQIDSLLARQIDVVKKGIQAL